MNVHASVEMNRAPPPAVTVESCTQAMYDGLLSVGAEIDYLEKSLSSLLHNEREPDPTGAAALVQPPQPEAISKLQGLAASIEAYRQRLEAIRLRLAL